VFENQGDYVLDVTCTELLLGPVVIACSCCIDLSWLRTQAHYDHWICEYHGILCFSAAHL